MVIGSPWFRRILAGSWARTSAPTGAVRRVVARAYTARDARFSILTLLFAAALIGSLAVKFWLATRQMRHVAAHRDAVPAPFARPITLAAHQKAADYTLAKARFGLLGTAFGAAVLLGWTLLGGLDALNVAVRDAIQPRLGDLAYQLALLAAFVLIGSLLELPFELYGTFRIEQRFGFNRMTWRLYRRSTW